MIKSVVNHVKLIRDTEQMLEIVTVCQKVLERRDIFSQSWSLLFAFLLEVSHLDDQSIEGNSLSDHL